MSDTLIKVEGVSKKFCRSLKRSLWYGLQDLGNELRGHRHGGNGELRPDEFWAVKEVSFEVKRGECLGLIGRNGAGKTTLLRMLNGLIKPDQGRIEMHGRVGALIALGAGFNPILTGRENIYVNASVLGLTKKEIEEKIDEIVDFAEISEFIDMPVQSYSSGMQVRLGFSVAAALEPDILLLDEVLAVGDATFRSKCLKKIGSILNQCAVIFVSHDAWSIRRICDSIIWLRRGSIIYHGNTEIGMEQYAIESTNVGVPPVFINTAEFISSISYHADSHNSRSQDDIEIIDVDVIIEFYSNRTTTVGICHCNIITLDEILVAQSEFKRWMPNIKIGLNVIAFKIVGLQLARGNYSLALAIWSENNKQLFINLRHFFHLSIKGHIHYGCYYIATTEPLHILS